MITDSTIPVNVLEIELSAFAGVLKIFNTGFPFSQSVIKQADDIKYYLWNAG